MRGAYQGGPAAFLDVPAVLVAMCPALLSSIPVEFFSLASFGFAALESEGICEAGSSLFSPYVLW